MEDLIRRQDAIDELQKEINKGIPPFDDVMGSIRCGVRLARNIIEDLPSAQPERKKGKWLLEKIYEDEHGIEEFNYFCSECGAPAYEFSQPYCHRCGAKMRKTEAKYEQEALSRL